MSLKKEKIDISANNLAVDGTSLARSLMYIKKKKALILKPVEHQQALESM